MQVRYQLRHSPGLVVSGGRFPFLPKQLVNTTHKVLSCEIEGE